MTNPDMTFLRADFPLQDMPQEGSALIVHTVHIPLGTGHPIRLLDPTGDDKTMGA
jgi:hypothetical protein